MGGVEHGPHSRWPIMEACIRHFHPVCSCLQTTWAGHSGFKPHTTSNQSPPSPRSPRQTLVCCWSPQYDHVKALTQPDRPWRKQNTHAQVSAPRQLFDWLAAYSRQSSACRQSSLRAMQRAYNNQCYSNVKPWWKGYAAVNYRSGESNYWRGIDLRQLRTWKQVSVAKSEVLL